MLLPANTVNVLSEIVKKIKALCFKNTSVDSTETKKFRNSTNLLLRGIDWDAIEKNPTLKANSESPKTNPETPKANPETLDKTISAPTVVNKVNFFPRRKFFSPSSLKVLAVVAEAKQHPKIIAAIAAFFIAAGAGGIILLNRQFSSPIVQNKASSISVPAGVYRFGGDPFYAALNPSGLAALLQQEYSAV